MKEKILLILLLLTSINCFGQKEDFNWIFNWSPNDSFTGLPENSMYQGGVLDFNNLPPVFSQNSSVVLDFDKTNAIVSDPFGDILFYSNGQAIYGADHEPIVNGDTINYSPKWDLLSGSNGFGEIKPTGMRVNQLIGFIPWPDHDDKWLVLYQNYENVIDSTQEYYELWSAEVVFNENNKLEVRNKDELVNQKLFRAGMLTACQHANGRDWWVLQSNRDSLYSYLINSDGIELRNIQEIPFDIMRLGGQTKFSEDGSQFAFFGIRSGLVGNGIYTADIFHSQFDRCSGLINNISTFTYQKELSILNNGIEFSPNGRFIYVSEVKSILQYDTEEENFLENPTVVGTYDGFECDHWSEFETKFGTMQRGPDGKIYISGDQQCFYMHLINNPDEKGAACNFQQRAIRLESFHIGTVPNFNTVRLGPLDGSSCDTLDLDNNPVAKFWYEQDSVSHKEIQFRDVSYYRPEDWLWTFGDGNSSSEMNPLHSYETNGVYEVCLTVNNENSSNTSCEELQIGPVVTQDIQREYEINIFPNPIEDLTRLVFRDYLPENAQLVFYDSSGKKVFSRRVYQESLLDLSSLLSGVYLYEIHDGDLFLQSGKILKM